MRNPIFLGIIRKLFNIMIYFGFVPEAFGLGIIFPDSKR